ncbi:hypothetical protein ACF05T_32135 [Streptomyces lateritius]|uniref:Histidine kinase/HSP90-like ATPase domain-containing protein n=1 Tax=Streptomyces lateritius TaxID=67313 RepID=A0ABW6YLA2_9ACTN
MDTMSVGVATDRPAGSVAVARDSARSFLEGLVPTLASEAADTVVLVVSELVTDALRHGGDTCTLTDGLGADDDLLCAFPPLHPTEIRIG